MSETQQTQTVDAGVKLATYACGQGEPMLLIMGFACCAADWGPLRPALAARGRVITFDNRGTGNSVAALQSLTLEQMAEDALAVLDAYGLSSVNLVGYSMGGMIAQLLALRHPERVRRLVLMSTHAGAQSCVPPTKEATQALFQPRASVEALIRSQFQVFSAPGFVEARAADFEAMVQVRLERLTPMQTIVQQMNAMQASERGERLCALRMPILIVHGRHDTLIPARNGEQLKSLLPHAELRLLEGCGHMLPWEAPDEIAQLVGDFFAG